MASVVIRIGQLLTVLELAVLGMPNAGLAQSDALSEAERLIRSLEPLPATPVKAVKVERKAVEIGGSKATGQVISSYGTSKLFAEFSKEGTFKIRTDEDTKWYDGKWSQTGNRISMKAGASTFNGTLSGSRLEGTRARRNAGTLVDQDDRWWLKFDGQ